MMKTQSIKKSEIKRGWHLVDLKGQILGRAASNIAQKLIGKNKVTYTPNLDCGDFVVVINAELVEVSGRKEKKKIYYHHTGYPSGLKAYTYEQMKKKDPRKIIIKATSNMLPKNKLRSDRLTRLKVFVDNNHIYKDKFKNKKANLAK